MASGTGWTFTGVNTYTGNTTNASGTLTIGGAGQLNNGTYAGAISNAATFIYASSAPQILSGVISGAGTLFQNGAGTLTLNGVDTYTGNTTIGSGSTLAMGGAGKLAAAGNVTNNGTFTYGSTASLTISGIISGTGALNENSGTLALSGLNTYSGMTTINGGTLNVGSDTNLGTAPATFVANQLVLNGGTLGLTATAADLATNRGISVTASSIISATSGQSPSIEGIISGSAPLTKSAAGNLSLNGANTFSGGLTITGGGVRFNNNQAAGTGTITITPASIVTLRNITPPSANTTTLTNAITLNAGGGNDVDLTAATGNTLALTGPISGAGYFTRGRATGAGGTILLSGNNSGWSGGLIFEGGILSLGSSNALGTGTLAIAPATGNAVILESSTPLTGVNVVTNVVNVTITNATFNGFSLGGANGLELAGPVSLSSTIGSAVAITNNNSGGSIFSGPVSGSGIGLTLLGTGTLTLAGTDTYSGNTTISSGTLALGSAGSINNSPVISIAAGATFDVSAIASYVLSGSTSLSASGSTLPGTINGGTTVSLGSQPISLVFDGLSSVSLHLTRKPFRSTATPSR